MAKRLSKTTNTDPDPCNLQLYESFKSPEERIHSIFERALAQLQVDSAPQRRGTSTESSLAIPWYNFLARGSTARRDEHTVKQRRAAFIHEMRVISKLRHRNIVQVLGVVMDRKAPPLLIMVCLAEAQQWHVHRLIVFVCIAGKHGTWIALQCIAQRNHGADWRDDVLHAS
jgi:hypothetical protein